MAIGNFLKVLQGLNLLEQLEDLLDGCPATMRRRRPASLRSSAPAASTTAPTDARRGWRLSPAFDITPAIDSAPQPLHEGPALAMATCADGSTLSGAQRLLAACGHFGLDADAAGAWLRRTAGMVARHWEPMLREAAAPVMADRSRLEALVGEAGAAFAYAEWLSSQL